MQTSHISRITNFITSNCGIYVSFEACQHTSLLLNKSANILCACRTLSTFQTRKMTVRLTSLAECDNSALKLRCDSHFTSTETTHTLTSISIYLYILKFAIALYHQTHQPFLTHKLYTSHFPNNAMIYGFTRGLAGIPGRRLLLVVHNSELCHNHGVKVSIFCGLQMFLLRYICIIMSPIIAYGTCSERGEQKDAKTCI